jgi:hypothetical protein
MPKYFCILVTQVSFAYNLGLIFIILVQVKAHSNVRNDSKRKVQQIATSTYKLLPHPLNTTHWTATIAEPTIGCASVKFIVEVQTDKGNMTEPKPHQISKQPTNAPKEYNIYQRMMYDSSQHDTTFKLIKKFFRSEASHVGSLLEDLIHDSHHSSNLPEEKLRFFEARFDALWRCMNNLHEATQFDLRSKNRVFVPEPMLEQVSNFIDTARQQPPSLESTAILLSIATYLLEHTSHLTKHTELITILDTVTLDWISKYSIHEVSRISRVIGTLVKEYWTDKSKNTFAWGVLAPYLYRECNQRTRSSSSYYTTVSEGLYNTLMKDSKVTTKVYKQQLIAWIETIPLGLTSAISRPDMVILVQTFLRIAPTFEGVFLACRLFQRISGQDVFEEQFAEYLKTYPFEQNTEQKFTALEKYVLF